MAGSCPSRECPGGELSWWGLSWWSVVLVRSCSGGKLSQ